MPARRRRARRARLGAARTSSLADGRARPAPAAARRRGRARCSRSRSAICGALPRSRGGCGGSSARPSGSRRAVRRADRRPRAATRSASSRATFDRMRERLARSTTRGASSSPTPRTSCARRSSRSAASSSCSTDEELDERDAPRVPRDDARAGRPADEARDRAARPLARWTPGGCRSSASRSTSTRSRRRSPTSSRRRPDERQRARGGRRDGGRCAWATSSACCRSAASLVENALVHTPPGTPASSCARATAGVLAVEDDGPGIPRGARGARLRALLPGRRAARVRQRPRARDRAGAGAGDGRGARAGVRAGADGVHAAATCRGRVAHVRTCPLLRDVFTWWLSRLTTRT